MQARRDENGLPILFDRACDRDLPDKLMCDRDVAGRVRQIRRPMAPAERSIVEARACALETALTPFADRDQDQVTADLAAMLSGFRYMRQEGDAADAAIEVTIAVLREFPAWAISRACASIVRERIERRYAPNDTETLDAVRAIVRPYRQAAEQARALLDAKVEVPAPPRPSRAEIEAKLGRPTGLRRDPMTEERRASLAADLAIRRSRNDAQGISVPAHPSGLLAPIRAWR